MKAPDVLTRDEIAALTEASDLRGAFAIVRTWGVIAAALAALAAFPHPLVFVATVVVLGGRQLALAILMHEAAHRTLFRTKALNDGVADWLCARPVWGDVARYRKHHVAHHAWAGSEKDPDRALVTPFPTTRGSMARKLLRDVTGLSALRRIAGLFLMDAEVITYNVSGDTRRLPWRGVVAHARAAAGQLWRPALVNAALFGVLFALGHAGVFAAWVAAWLTTYGLFLRIRSFAEHAGTELTMDPIRNTRTTQAGWLAQATVAPLNVNFHLEHHLLVAVPWFRLPQLHRMLRDRGALAHAVLAPGYVDVVRTMSAR